MSTELVSLHYDRISDNVLQNTETRGHNGAITPEQAEMINERYEIVLEPVLHGYGTDHVPDALLPDEGGESSAPGIDDYNHVKGIIDDMVPGYDTLFLESVGFEHEDSALSSFDRPKLTDAFNRSRQGNATADDRAVMEGVRRRAQEKADSYQIDTISYACEYAIGKGIDVVFADLDAYDTRQIQKAFGDTEDIGQQGPDDGPMFDAMIGLRDRRAVNTVKDFALENLPYGSDATDPEDKPRLVLMYGAAHLHDQMDLFAQMGLQTTAYEYIENDQARRFEEHRAFLGRQVMIHEVELEVSEHA